MADKLVRLKPCIEAARTKRPPTFGINSDGGCIGRFWWINTIQRTDPDWAEWLFPLWGTSHWYRGEV